MTGGYFSLFVAIVTYLSVELETLDPLRDDVVQIGRIFNCPAARCMTDL